MGIFFFVLLIVGAMVGWPIYLETSGNRAPGVITEKRESVRIGLTEWFRRFEVLATYSIPGQPLQHRAICDVDEKTYDSLHPGNTVTVYFLPSLLNQPFLPATRLSPCSTMASFSLNPSVARKLVAAFITLMTILFLWRVLRIRMAAWLLLPWLAVTFAYIGLPRAEPEPQHPAPATAIVDSIRTITTLGGTENSKSLRLQHPYQIVRLKFVPPGMDTPVIAVDKVDASSVPNLQEGRNANIVYDPAHPRIARLQGGTRLFPGHARMTVVLCCIAFIVLLAVVWLIGGFFRLIGRRRFG